MARTYEDGLAESAAEFPGAVATIREWLNERTDRDEVEEAFTVPASADADGRYRVELDHMISEADTVVIVCDGDTLTQIPYGVTPGAGEVGVAYGEIPVLEFHSSRATEEGDCTHTPLGTAVSSGRMNQLVRELVAVQEAVGGSRERLSFPVAGIPGTGNAVGHLWVPVWAAGRRVTQVTVCAGNLLGLSGSGVTQMVVTTLGAPGAVVHNTTGVVATPLAQSGATQARATLATNWALSTASGLWLSCWCTDATGGHGDLVVEIWLEAAA